MRLALITEVPINGKHGTGCLLLRLFAESGLEVTNIHPESKPYGHADMASIPVPEIKGAWLKGVGALRRSARLVLGNETALLTPPAPARYQVSDGLHTEIGKADLVLVVVHSLYGLHFLHECLRGMATVPPLLLWFMDCELKPGLPETIGAFLRRVSPAYWALTPEIKDTLAEVFPDEAECSEVHFHLGVTLPAFDRDESQRQEGPSVMIGTFWDARTAALLRDIWAKVRARSPQHQPLQWYATSEAVQRLQDANVTVEPQIAYRGFAEPLDLTASTEGALSLDAVLKEADLAVMPFSSSADPILDYARHSFPSRLADYCAYGLPIFALAHRESSVSRFIREHEIGLVHDGSSVDDAAEVLARYLADPERRAVHGRNARAVAEQMFDLHKVRGEFVADLNETALGRRSAPIFRQS